MSRPVPLCPLTIPSVIVQSPEGHGGMTTQRWPCLGSRCAWWADDGCQTGWGWCGKIPYEVGPAWPDPAATEED